MMKIKKKRRFFIFASKIYFIKKFLIPALNKQNTSFRLLKFVKNQHSMICLLTGEKFSKYLFAMFRKNIVFHKRSIFIVEFEL